MLELNPLTFHAELSYEEIHWICADVHYMVESESDNMSALSPSLTLFSSYMKHIYIPRHS